MGNAIFLFRYYDEDNFYALELNSKGKKKVALVKKSEGGGESIKETDIFFE